MVHYDLLVVLGINFLPQIAKKYCPLNTKQIQVDTDPLPCCLLKIFLVPFLNYTSKIYIHLFHPCFTFSRY